MTTTIVVCVACFLAFVWLRRRLKALDERDDVRAGFPAEQRKEWK